MIDKPDTAWQHEALLKHAVATTNRARADWPVRTFALKQEVRASERATLRDATIGMMEDLAETYGVEPGDKMAIESFDWGNAMAVSVTKRIPPYVADLFAEVKHAHEVAAIVGREVQEARATLSRLAWLAPLIAVVLVFAGFVLGLGVKHA